MSPDGACRVTIAFPPGGVHPSVGGGEQLAQAAAIVGGDLFDPDKRFALEQEAAALEEERARRVAHYEDLREALERERVRVLDHMLPQRHALRGDARLFPVAVEIRLPQAGR